MNLIRWTVIATVLAGATAAYGQAGQYPANQFLRGPTSGGASLPHVGPIVAADIASLIGGTVNTQSGDYTLQAGDCNNTVILTGVLKTLTVPAGTLCSAGQSIIVKNDNSTRGQVITGAGLPSDLVSAVNAGGAGNNILWQKQAFVIRSDGTNWKTIVNPKRVLATANLNVNTSTGSDSSDCQGTGSGACLSWTQAINIACGAFDSPTASGSIAITGTVHNLLWGGCSAIRILSVNGPGTVDDGGIASVALECDDTCTMLIGQSVGLTIAATAAGSINLRAGRGAIVDVYANTFTVTNGNASNVIIASSSHGNMGLDGTSTFAGGAGSTVLAVLFAQQQGQIQVNAAQTMTGAWTVSEGCYGTSGGIVDASLFAFSGGTVTGTRAVSDTGGGVNTQAHCPGNANGTGATSNWLN